MAHTWVTVQVENGMVIVKYNGDQIQELTREEAIECGGEIAEVASKLTKGKTPSDADQEPDPTPTDQEPDPTPTDITTVSSLSSGETYTAVVDRISGSGNAIIEPPEEVERGHINLGPIDRSSVGTEVRFKYTGSIWARCLTEDYISDSYSPRDGKSTGTAFPVKGGRTTIKSTSSNSDRETPSSSNNPFTGKGIDNKNDLINGPM